MPAALVLDLVVLGTAPVGIVGLPGLVLGGMGGGLGPGGAWGSGGLASSTGGGGGRSLGAGTGGVGELFGTHSGFP